MNFFLYNKVEKIEKKNHFVLTLEDGTVIESEKVLLCAGPWTGEIAETMGLRLPLAPERHEAIITERMPKFLDPMVVDYREDGCYFNQFLGGQICGCYTPIPNVPGIREDAPEVTEVLSPLRWLTERGHVVEFSNGTLSVPTSRRPAPPSLGKTRSPKQTGDP